MTGLSVVLTPGASATRDHSSLVGLDRALTAEGIVVVRIDLPASRPGPRVTQAIVDAATALRPPVVLGGRSFGGRMCSMAVADGLAAAGLVLISYPLHPPGRPETLRVEHFPRLAVPCLFVSGTRDAFATPVELEAATAAIPGEVTHAWIEGGDHGLRGKDRPVAEAVTGWVTTWARAAPRSGLRPGGPPG